MFLGYLTFSIVIIFSVNSFVALGNLCLQDKVQIPTIRTLQKKKKNPNYKKKKKKVQIPTIRKKIRNFYCTKLTHSHSLSHIVF